MKASSVPREDVSSSPLVSTGVAGVTPPGVVVVVVDVEPLGGAEIEGLDEEVEGTEEGGWGVSEAEEVGGVGGNCCSFLDFFLYKRRKNKINII